MKTLLAFTIALAQVATVCGQTPDTGEAKLLAAGWRSETYKHAAGADLRIWILEPKSEDGPPRAAAVFFFGGGWQGRNMAHFQKQGEFLVRHGLVAILPDYRAERRYGGTPFECLEDAKSAIRYIRGNADRWRIDPRRIAVGGGSAGGHLAIAAACLEGFNAESDDMGVSCVPDALVLFNPVYDNGPNGYGHERIGERYRDFSPFHNLKSGMPPTVVFFGTNDQLVPVTTIDEFQRRMTSLGNDCETHLFEGGVHGFFNQEPSLGETLRLMEQFLRRVGFIEAGDQAP